MARTTLKIKALGIYREILHSPDRESDDALILKAAAQRLSALGCEVACKSPEDVSPEVLRRFAPDLIFLMCEQEGVLDAVRRHAPPGARIVNSPDSVLNTYRFRMLPALQAARVPMPPSELISVRARPPEFGRCWVKRGDVHNTQKGDVVPARNAQEAAGRLADFAARGIERAVVQEHAPGDLIKFYGVGLPSRPADVWFRWFYHKGQDLKEHPFSGEELRQVTCRAAAALGLEVFGGDVIVGPAGGVRLIDINAWPSFALFREEAARAIARHAFSRVDQGLKLQNVSL